MNPIKMNVGIIFWQVDNSGDDGVGNTNIKYHKGCHTVITIRLSQIITLMLRK